MLDALNVILGLGVVVKNIRFGVFGPAEAKNTLAEYMTLVQLLLAITEITSVVPVIRF